MNTLKDLLFKLAEIEYTLTESKGELSPEQDQYIQTVHGAMIDKIDDYAFVLARLESTAEYYKEQEQAMKAKRQAIENAVERFRDRLKESMLNSGQKSLQGAGVKFTISPTKGKVVITDETAAKILYGRIVETVKIDLDKIKADIDNGVNLDCAKVLQTHSLKITKSKGDA
jgi:hypothetical protein